MEEVKYYRNGNETVASKARKAAMRTIPMVGEGEAYRQRLADFSAGYMAGHGAVVRRVGKMNR